METLNHHVQRRWWSLFIELTAKTYSSDRILFILYRVGHKQGQINLFLIVLQGRICYSFQIKKKS